VNECVSGVRGRNLSERRSCDHWLVCVDIFTGCFIYGQRITGYVGYLGLWCRTTEGGFFFSSKKSEKMS
jgi:hypothetical protein